MSGKDLGNMSSESSDDEKKNGNNKRGYYSCEICSKQFKYRRYLKQHLDDHRKKNQCNICRRSFTRKQKLQHHKVKFHNSIQEEVRKTPNPIECDVCGKVFGKRYNLKRHKYATHAKSNKINSSFQFSCRHCDCIFNNYEDLFNHVNENHPLNQEGGRVVNNSGNDEIIPPNQSDVQMDTTQEDPPKTHSSNQLFDSSNDESALANGVVNRNILPEGNNRYDVLTFLANIRDQVRQFLESRIRTEYGIKWNLCLHVEMQRSDNSEVTETTPFFRSRTYAALSTDDFSEHDLNEAMQKIFASLEKFMREGSGWYLNKVLKLEIHTVFYRPLGGSTYLPLPKTLSYSRSLLNIVNNDEKCFLYCLLASLHPTKTKPENVENYLAFKKEINMSEINYPVTVADISKVESQNHSISINVFTYEDNSILPLKITEKRGRSHHINLLLLTNSNVSHFCLITNLNSFLARTKTNKNETHFCCYCLHGFVKKSNLEQHQPYCSKHQAQRVILPTPNKNDILKFTSYGHTLKVPFVIYADFETIIKPIYSCQPQPTFSSTTATSKLEVCGYGYKVVSQDSKYTKQTVIYRGQDAGTKLIECLLEEEKKISDILSTIEPMQTDDNLIIEATHCCLCRKRFTVCDKLYNRIVRHHNHFTGEIIGPACNACNLNCKQATHIPVIFHNLKNFDAHILCQNIGHFKSKRLTCIAQNTERYVSFTLGRLRFIDSLQFLPASLDTLINDLKQDGLEAFQSLLSETNNIDDAQLLLRKGVYPYEYMDSFDKFENKELPSKEQFYSTIKKEHISDEDYRHAKKVFEHFNMASLGEYHDLYLKTDVVLLSDVFESFRKLCLKQYDLDPCHYYTSPGLSWSACLKSTGIELELLTDIDKILMVEAGIRGGISQISNRYKKANNPYVQDYDCSKPTTFLQYLDANNLYGWAMIQSLPVEKFHFMTEKDINSLDIMAIPENADTGYILEVTLEYPKDLHDKHNCLPLAPEKKCISNEELSPYAKYILRKLHGVSEDQPLPHRGKVEKLLTTLADKNHYILHYRNLQLYHSLGMKLRTIHRVLQFKQKPWMKSYIDKNTEMRQQATSTFQKNFYKLMNVSVFGKTMENVRLHNNIELVHTRHRLRKVAAKPTYKTTTILNQELAAVQLYKAKVNLFKPIYCGMAILDLSKYLMYDFWYNYIKEKYGDTAQLQMTDTDSLLFSCQTDDLYKDMQSSMEYFDTSDYPKGHVLHSDLNKKVLGKMKDETNGNPISEFVGLRSKMYSFTCNDKDFKRAKGISKIAIAKQLKHKNYKEVLFDETNLISSMDCLRSHKHELHGVSIQKTGLSAFDDKRYLIDSVNSYAYKHYKIADDTNDDGKIEYSDSTWSILSTKDCLKKYRPLDRPLLTTDAFTITPCVKM